MLGSRFIDWVPIISYATSIVGFVAAILFAAILTSSTLLRNTNLRPRRRKILLAGDVVFLLFTFMNFAVVVSEDFNPWQITIMLVLLFAVFIGYVVFFFYSIPEFLKRVVDVEP